MDKGSAGDDGAGESFVGQEMKVMIKAAEGGAVSVGAAALTIPKGALSADTKISIKVESKKGRPDEEHVLLDVYDFGPDGTTFNAPVTLAFDVSKVEMPTGGTAKIAWQNGDKWETLPTTIANGMATAPTTHFTPYTLVFVLDDDGDIVQVGGQCGADFEACGGDIAGTWSYTGACTTIPPDLLGSGSDSGENPFAACSEQPKVEFTLDITGTVTFGAAGEFSVDQTVTTSGGVTVPLSCIMELGADSCDALQVPVSEDGKSCVLVDGSDQEPQHDTTTGTYTAEGSKLTISEEGDTEPDTSVIEYCVKGDTLSVRITEDEGTVVEYTATRQ